MTDTLLQMTFAAMATAQNAVPQTDTSNIQTENNNDFKSLLDQKHAELRKPEKPSANTSEKEEPLKQETLESSSIRFVDLDNFIQGMMLPVQPQGEAILSQPIMQFSSSHTTVQTQELMADFSTPIDTGDSSALARSTNLLEISGTIQQENILEKPQGEQPLSNQMVEGEVVGETGKSQVQTTQGSSLQQDSQELNSSPNPQSSQSQDTDIQVVVENSNQPLFRETESMPIKIGDPSVLDTGEAEFDAKLAKTISHAAENGIQKVQITLTPENLGTIVVEMTRNQNGVLHVVLHAENEKALQILGEHSAALGTMLQNSGQGDVRIEIPQPRQEDQTWQQPDQNNGQHQGDQAKEQQRQQQNTEDFLQQMRLGIFQQEQEDFE